MGEDNLKIELISKDDVLNALIPIMCEFSIDPYIQGRIIGCVMNCPIAYDVEKVVTDLEEVSNRYLVEDFGIKGIIQKAIYIVENGGK